MKKKLTIGIIGFMLISILVGIFSKQLTEPTDLGEELLPNIYISQLDSTQVPLQSIEYGKGLIVALINSECEICHSQIDEFYKRGDKLNDARIIVLSYQDLKEIQEFSQKYPDPPFSFWQVEYEILNSYFQEWSTPQTLLYNDKMQMIKRIDGISRIAHLKKILED